MDGGPPALAEAMPVWPISDDEVRAALQSALDDGSWGRYDGRHVPALCARLSELCCVPFVYPCCSGTVAVELALRGLRIGPGDEVILAGYDFPGNFRCIEASGALPVLVDIDPETWCLDHRVVERAIGPATRAILVSHLHGGLADMRAICRLAAERGLAVVEDACQATGADLQGRCAGTWGDVGVLSFGGSKLLTAGRGGCLLTRREDVFQRVKVFCERGNHAFPLSELQAAVLLPQINRLAERNRTRAANVRGLLAQLGEDARLRAVALDRPECSPSYFKLAWLYQPHRQTSRETFLAASQAEGIPIDAGFRGFTHRGPRRCRRLGPLTHSRTAAERTVLLHHPILLQPATTIERLAQGIRKVLDALA